ncbi:MAG: hypothetical protein ACTHKV_14915 [Flavipsychrobacter sp.]
MTIRIHNMPTKLVQENFLHLVPLKEQEIAAGKTYEVLHDKYGRLGEAMCVVIYINSLQEIRAGVELMEGNPTYVTTARNSGLHGYDKIQVCFFRMLSRTEDPFRQMLDAEYKRLGIIVTRQKEMF